MKDKWLKKTFGNQNMYCGDLYQIDMISKNKDYCF